MKVWNELASFLCWASKHLYNQNVGNLPLSRSWWGCFVVFDDELLLPGKMKQVPRWWLVRRTRKMRTLIKVRPGEMNATWKGNTLIWGMTELLWRKRKVRPCKVSCVSIERLTQITVAFSFGVCDDAPHCSSRLCNQSFVRDEWFEHAALLILVLWRGRMSYGRARGNFN